MASLADLQSVYAPAPPTGFTLADIEVQGQLAAGQAGIGRERVLRNFNKYDLPDLLSSQAARGAYNTSATEDKRERLATGAGDQLTDIEYALAQRQAELAANGLLAKTGIRLGNL